ncbi:hypothetical protein SAY87_001929 [Trapa incisa]|uniref:Protein DETOXIFICATION n=1 Tax=Trapa incisa TaxID=236973 RepID=A0AAN7JSH6_9MYRT|nr:hypothetical protein SAY87_001929 [Trapa incisa]
MHVRIPEKETLQIETREREREAMEEGKLERLLAKGRSISADGDHKEVIVSSHGGDGEGERGEGGGGGGGGVGEEMKRVVRIAGPMVAVMLSLYFLQIIAVTMAGHLGELELASTAIAISFGAVTGFSPVYGMASALETLCGQAYGAKEYHRFSVHIHTAILSLILTCFPLSLIWLFMGRILILLGQDPEIAHESGRFIVHLIPALFAYATLHPIIKFYVTQSLVLPMLVTSCITIAFHIVFCWVMVFKSSWGSSGGALAIGASYWLNVILLSIYRKYSPSCAKTRVSVTMTEIFRATREFFSVAIPSAIMICLEWWSFELLTMLSGLLPNPKLEASVLSICLATIATLYNIPDSIGAAASTRVSNELGAGNPRAAHVTVVAALLLTLVETTILSSTVFACKRVFGYIFCNEEEVVDYVANMAPLISVSIVLDSLHGVLSGISRGCGWQDIGAYINLASYYLCGIPGAVLLGFWLHFRGKGLWVGILVGSFVQTALLLLVTISTDWEEQAYRARKRMFKEEILVSNDEET